MWQTDKKQFKYIYIYIYILYSSMKTKYTEVPNQARSKPDPIDRPVSTVKLTC